MKSLRENLFMRKVAPPSRSVRLGAFRRIVATGHVKGSCGGEGGRSFLKVVVKDFDKNLRNFRTLLPAPLGVELITNLPSCNLLLACLFVLNVLNSVVPTEK